MLTELRMIKFKLMHTKITTKLSHLTHLKVQQFEDAMARKILCRLEAVFHPIVKMKINLLLKTAKILAIKALLDSVIHCSHASCTSTLSKTWIGSLSIDI